MGWKCLAKGEENDFWGHGVTWCNVSKETFCFRFNIYLQSDFNTIKIL